MALGYTTRQPLPHLLEIGRDGVLTCPVYLGARVAVTSGTVSVYAPGETEPLDDVDAEAITVDADGAASFTVAGSVTSSRSPSDAYRVEWTLLVAGETVVFRDELYLVRNRLRPVIADDDIGQRVRMLGLSVNGRLTKATTYTAEIEEADIRLQRDLIALGRRPDLVVSASALRECWLAAALSVIFDGLAAASGSDGDPYSARSAEWSEKYELALTKARLAMDWGATGAATAGTRTGPRPGSVWLC